MKTIERTHSELERFHYREVETNPQYAVEGLMDIRREEWEMNFPVREETQVAIKEQPWTGKQRDIIQQLRAEMQHIHGEVHELKTNKKSNKYEYI